MIHFKFKKKILLLFFCSFFISLKASYILIPMDESQSNHLKAYGIAYYAINNKLKVDWLLNYKGGSFMIKYHKTIEDECNYRGVFFNVIADIQSNQILQSIASPSVNQDIVRLEKAPKIAVYSPKNKQPWDDAVTLALSYSEIPYDIIYDNEILETFFLSILPKNSVNCLKPNVSQNGYKGNNVSLLVGSSTINTHSRLILK